MAVTVQQKTSRRSEIQKLITHRSWRKRGHVAIKAQGIGREWQDLGHRPLLGFVVGVLWGSQAMSGLVKPPRVGFGNFLYKGYTGKGPARWGRVLSQGSYQGQLHQELIFTLRDVIEGRG